MATLLGASILLQVVAAILAWWHMRATRGTIGWALISAALVLMALRRCVLLYDVLTGNTDSVPDPAAEWISLVVSGLFIAGLIWIGPFFWASWRAEEALRESGERLRLVINSALDAVVGMDAQGRVTEWNAQAEAVFGWTRSEAVGRELASLIIPPHSREAHRQGLNRFLQTGEGPVLNRRIELTGVRRDGSEFPVELTVVPARSGGEPFFTAFLRDITERKRAERQLSRQALEARLLHQATALAAETDSFEEALQRCVDAVCEITGWPVGHVYLPEPERRRLVPTRIWHLDQPETFATFCEATEASPVAPGEGLPGRIWSTREPVWIPNLHQEGNFPRKSLCRDLPLKGAFGFPIRIRGETAAVLEFFSRDEMPVNPDLLLTVQSLGEQVGRVMERKQADQVLKYQHRLVRTITDNATAALFMMDERGHCTFMNPAAKAMTGYPFEEIRQKPLHEMIHHTHPDGTPYPLSECPIDRALPENFDIRAHEDVFIRKDGTFFPVMCAASPIFENGRPVSTVLEVRDVTEEKRAQEALQQINRELQHKNLEMEQFVYSVSHDLKSPLVTMTGFVSMLRDDLAAGRTAEVLDSIQRIERATLRMRDLIDDLLQLSRAGRIRSEPEEVDVTALVRELADELSGRLEESGAELQVEERMSPVIADRARLAEVFDNLLTNAIKYGARGPAPKITVGSAVDDGHVRYFVRDNGPGIAEQYHQRIFGLFQRLDNQEEGTGVGLAIVARIMDVHGGRTWVESAPGQGATFWIEFPQPPAVRPSVADDLEPATSQR